MGSRVSDERTYVPIGKIQETPGNFLGERFLRKIGARSFPAHLWGYMWEWMRTQTPDERGAFSILEIENK